MVIKKASSSFLKKRTKKLLLFGMRTDRPGTSNQQSKSFLVLFFKKELLTFFACNLLPLRLDMS
jgi:hypothetical protein